MFLITACGPTPSGAPTTAPAPPAATAAPPTAAPATGSTPASAATAQAPNPATSTAAQPTTAPGATPTSALAASSPSGQTLTIASLANLSKTLHPFPDAASYTQSWTDVAILLWGGHGSGGLLTFDWDSLEYKPAMATDMPKVSADGKTYTFTLRDDLKWSDGSPITVDDFQFAWDNASKPENNFVGLDDLAEIASFKTSADTRTIEVTLNEQKARDVGLGIASEVGPVPKKVWAGKPWNDTSANPEILNPSVVLGPYKVQDFKIAEGATFVPVNTYPGGQPKIPQVEILPGQQPTVAYESLKSGRANFAPNIPPAQYQEAKSNPDLNMVEWTAANAVYRALEFNTARPFLSDQRVREALARAVSRDDVLDVAEGGLATPQYSFIQPTNTKWANTNVEKYDLDMDKAKQLLQDAGYQLQGTSLIGKDGQPVKIQVLYPTSSAPRAKMATYLQQQYKQLGIEVEVKGLDFNAYTDQVQHQKDYDISLATYGGGSLDPELGPRAQLITGGQQNVTGYSNPQVDQLFKQGATELDDARRKQIYDQAQQLVNADLPSHYLYALKAFSPVSKKVQGVMAHKGDRLDYNDAMLAWSVAQ